MSIRTRSLPRRLVTDFTRNWTLFEQIWLVVFTGVNLYVYTELGQSLLGLIASLTGMVTVVLVAKGRLANYYFGIVNVSLYGFLALQSGFYGEVMLNWLYFLPLQFVGIYVWSRNLDRTGLVSVEGLTLSQRLRWGIGAIGAIAGYGLFLTILNGNLPFFDSTSTVLSVLAQILMIKCVTEQWVMWIVVDVVSIYMWMSTFLSTGTGFPMVVMWSAYLVNACYGWFNWRRMDSTGL